MWDTFLGAETFVSAGRSTRVHPYQHSALAATVDMTQCFLAS
jgi:hypothetical protein